MFFFLPICILHFHRPFLRFCFILVCFSTLYSLCAITVLFLSSLHSITYSSSHFFFTYFSPWVSSSRFSSLASVLFFPAASVRFSSQVSSSTFYFYYFCNVFVFVSVYSTVCLSICVSAVAEFSSLSIQSVLGIQI